MQIHKYILKLTRTYGELANREALTAEGSMYYLRLALGFVGQISSGIADNETGRGNRANYLTVLTILRISMSLKLPTESVGF